MAGSFDRIVRFGRDSMVRWIDSALIVGLVAGLTVTASFAGSEWPGLRGPSYDGAVRGARLFEGDSAELAIGWEKQLGSGYSATAVGDGKVFTMFAEGDGDFLAAFDVESGDELWRYRIGDTYAGHDGSHDGPISTPVLHGDRVYALGAWGHLFALNASNGTAIWKTHLVEDYEAVKPYFGFTTAPVVLDDVLVVEIGAGEGKSVAGFASSDGKKLWSVGDDEINYHSPIVATLGGKRQVVAVGSKTLQGLDAASGEVLWSYEHGGDERAMGGGTIIPVPADDGRFFLVNKIDSSVMLQVDASKKGYEIRELWSNNSIKSTYVTPVYNDGYLYGISGRILTCVDAATGETKWRSRKPGDGFPTLVGEHLVIVTKPGGLHVVEATPEAYREVASLEVFEEHSWSQVAYADGHLFGRSMAKLARIDIDSSGAGAGGGESWIASTAFGAFLAEAEQAEDRQAVVDAYLAKQASFPIVEGSDLVHFVYSGDGDDVGIVGDMIGFRREDPMNRLPGTDLFHYSMRLEPDAAVLYGFIPDYDEPVADPRNPRNAEGLFGEVSWFSMPAWHAPDYLTEADVSRRGRIETVEWERPAEEPKEDEEPAEPAEEAEEEKGPRIQTVQVYLPAGYDTETGRRYPVLYVHGGKAALEQGKMNHALDHLIGETVEPLIAIFVIPEDEDRRPDPEDYGKMIGAELIPRIDEQYRTIPEAWARGSVGAGRGANAALMGALMGPGVFGRVGAQSPSLGVSDVEEVVRGADEQPLVLYMDWGTYHLRSPHEAWDLAVESRALWSFLREQGYRPAGGELPEGFGWSVWRAHTGELLAALFPVAE